MRKSTLTFAEAGTVTLICFGLFMLFSFQAMAGGFPEVRFSDESNAGIVGLELVLGACALIYLHLRGFDIPSLYPVPTWRDSLIGLGLFVLSWLAAVVAMALFHTPGQTEAAEFSIHGSSALSTVALSLVNGSYEEVFLLGVLVRGLRGFGLSLAVGLPLLVRVLYHTYQGPLGMIAVAAVGLVLTLAYVGTGRLWPPVLAHILLDAAALA